MGVGTVLSLSVHTSTGGGVPHLTDGGGGTPSQVWMGGTLCPVPDRPIPGLDREGTPISGLDGGYPHPADRGYPHPRSGWGIPQGISCQGLDVVPPVETGWGTPHPGVDGVPPCPGLDGVNPPPPPLPSGDRSP